MGHSPSSYACYHGSCAIYRPVRDYNNKSGTFVSVKCADNSRICVIEPSVPRSQSICISQFDWLFVCQAMQRGDGADIGMVQKERGKLTITGGWSGRMCPPRFLEAPVPLKNVVCRQLFLGQSQIRTHDVLHRRVSSSACLYQHRCPTVLAKNPGAISCPADHRQGPLLESLAKHDQIAFWMSIFKLIPWPWTPLPPFKCVFFAQATT